MMVKEYFVVKMDTHFLDFATSSGCCRQLLPEINIHTTSLALRSTKPKMNGILRKSNNNNYEMNWVVQKAENVLFQKLRRNVPVMVHSDCVAVTLIPRAKCIP